MPPRRREEPFRVTTAPVNRSQERSGRVRRYLISMAVRTSCFIGAVAVGPGWLRWVLIAGAVLLPYLAVIFANTQGLREEDYEIGNFRREQYPELTRPPNDRIG